MTTGALSSLSLWPNITSHRPLFPHSGRCHRSLKNTRASTVYRFLLLSSSAVPLAIGVHGGPEVCYLRLTMSTSSFAIIPGHQHLTQSHSTSQYWLWAVSHHGPKLIIAAVLQPYLLNEMGCAFIYRYRSSGKLYYSSDNSCQPLHRLREKVHGIRNEKPLFRFLINLTHHSALLDHIEE